IKTAPQQKPGEEYVEDVKDRKVDSSKISEVWLPNSNTAFRLLMSANLCSALMNNITDCDETYNYWEPLHHLLYGEGFQTWEYSPAYAIRSWAYIYMHSMFTWAHFGFLNSNKLLVFYFIRMIFGLICTLCQVQFYEGVALRFGNNVARILLTFMVLSTGMFISATAFLPSTFCMFGTYLFMGLWLQGKLNYAILTVAASAILGWPFSAALGVPLAFDVLVRRQKFWFFTKWCLVAIATMLVPCFALDSYFYGKPVIASLNILFYNVFTEHGPDIYGTEPLSYYLINGFLNFNVAFILALATIVIVPLVEVIIMQKLKGYKPPVLLISFSIAPMYIWILIFFTRPHKEERFLFPIYPLICLSASITLATIQKLYGFFKLHKYLNVQWIAVVVLTAYGCISLSRSFVLFNAYHGSMELYPKLHNIADRADTSEKIIHICMGKEWHRFPSSFFLPQNFTLDFIESEFRGQLPAKFQAPGVNGTRIEPRHFNDENLEEKSRYVSLDSCHFIIDLNHGEKSRFEPIYSEDKKHWQVIKEVDYLIASKSNSRFHRAFYIPFYFNDRNVFGKYQLLQSKTNLLKRKP
uniref:Mannosyltransferase n=1 Tax=Ciona savignyi TaxID=51511 RepID=H2YLZ4_CIOSA